MIIQNLYIAKWKSIVDLCLFFLFSLLGMAFFTLKTLRISNEETFRIFLGKYLVFLFLAAKPVNCNADIGLQPPNTWNIVIYKTHLTLFNMEHLCGSKFIYQTRTSVDSYKCRNANPCVIRKFEAFIYYISQFIPSHSMLFQSISVS